MQTRLRAQLLMSGREFRVALRDLESHVEALAALVTLGKALATEQDGRDESARAATEVKRSLDIILLHEYRRPIELVTRGLDIARRSAASARMLQKLTSGREQVRLLGIMIAPRLRGQSDQLAEWRSIMRVMRQGGRGDGSVRRALVIRHDAQHAISCQVDHPRE